ncbi:MAG: hypothetical protein PHO07_17000, partial [Pirellulales bacterium]|nr:hypothetical protein [Pirellulales bacterium]
MIFTPRRLRRAGLTSAPARPKYRLGAILALPLLAGLAAGPSAAGEQTPQVTSELRGRAVSTLRDVLERQERWVKVHAAEFLLGLDYPEGVEREFTEELERHGTEPEYRIGIWRVLAKAAYDPRENRRFIARIRDVFLDSAAPDRLHAAETLAKLGYAIPQETGAAGGGEPERQAFERAAGGGDSMAVYARWVLLNSDPRRDDSRLAEMLSSADAGGRGT